VGYFEVFYLGDRTHGFLLDNGSYTTVDAPGLPNAIANGINNSGQIVGSYSDAAGDHGFLFDLGSYTTLDVPGSAGTAVTGINDSGQIVGYYSNALPYIILSQAVR
jgi:probable HAF family extracellular repeat protein